MSEYAKAITKVLEQANNIALLEAELATLRAELAGIDSTLARRPALEGDEAAVRLNRIRKILEG